MKMQDIKKMKDTDIVGSITEKRNELRSARFGSTGGRANNVKAEKGMRKDIARLMTEISLRRIQSKKDMKEGDKVAKV